MTLEEYTRIKRKAEDEQREADRAAGQYQQLLSQIKKDYGFGSIKDAEKALQKMNKEEEGLAAECERAMKEYETEFGTRLG